MKPPEKNIKVSLKIPTLLNIRWTNFGLKLFSCFVNQPKTKNKTN